MNGRLPGVAFISSVFARSGLRCREIVRVILGETLKVNYTIDPGVQGTSTLGIAKPLARSELLPTLETLLNQNGATITQSDGIYRVSP